MALRDHSLFESIPDALLVVGRDGSVVFANRHAERLFGCEPGKLIGLGVEELLPKRYRQRHEQQRAEFTAAPAVRPMGSGRELCALRCDGREFSAEIAIGPSGDGEFAIAIVRDITEVLATRSDLKFSKEQTQIVLQSLDSRLAMLNGKGEILVVNDAWEDFARENHSGWNAPLGVGDDYLEACQLSAVDDPVALRALVGIRSVLDGSRRLFTLEYPCHGPSQEQWFSMRVTPTGARERGIVVDHIDVTERVRARIDLERALAEVSELKNRLEAEATYLREEIESNHIFEEMVGNSEAMKVMFHKVEQAAKTDATVLLLGETGTGKELLAHALHARSNRTTRPLIKIDCATLPAGLIESELFGHEKGTFTGAHKAKVGRFELAAGGTVFLDEIGELSLDLQAKLLRVLQESEFQRLGSNIVHKVDARIIAATNRDLQVEMREGRFRSDLYYRLSVFPIECPPLRERRDDIPLLVSFFLSKYRDNIGKTIDSVATTSMDMLVAYDWPGNIRELQNVIERAVILCSGDTLTVEEALGAPEILRHGGDRSLKHDLEAVERSNIRHALEKSDWKVKGEGNAASRLGLKPSTLRSRMRKLEITKPRVPD